MGKKPSATKRPRSKRLVSRPNKGALGSNRGRRTKRTLYTATDVARELPLASEGPKNPEPYRAPWRRDYARVIHCPAFRRLQGKTQLFPSSETDFFRNRLTHSLEVAQIAKSIAIRINSTEPFFNRTGFRINTDLVETAGLVHDIGHPPFGHNGEQALDECMRTTGGFEGNAQTLRILAKVEKRDKQPGASQYGTMKSQLDGRVGLNLCHRTLAATLKYDRQIEYDRASSDALQKGYYKSEAELVARIKHSVTGQADFTAPFKTVECQVMDIADDIAYSTYDLEDSLKARFLTPLSLFGASENLATEVCNRVSKNLKRPYTKQEMIRCLYRLFQDLFKTNTLHIDFTKEESLPLFIAYFSNAADNLMSRGYVRTKFTSELVGRFISGVRVKPLETIPALSTVSLRPTILEEVEVLKHFTFCSLIVSPRLKISGYRGIEIVKDLFRILSDKNRDGFRLLPDDVQELYHEVPSEERHRVVCDFIAGMTDRYAIEFYGRLTSEDPETIFKPH